MTVTFLNLVFVSGILEGIVQGASNDLKVHYSGDLIITPEENREDIIQTSKLIDHLKKQSEIKTISVRQLEGVQVEKDKETTKPNLIPNNINATLAGINFNNEKSVTALDQFLIEGNYPSVNDKNKILIGSGYLSQYESAIEENTLDNVAIGDIVKITYKNNIKTYQVAGILKTKFSEVNSRIFINNNEFETLTGKSKQFSNEIAMIVKNPTEESLLALQKEINPLAKNSDAKVETWNQSQGGFFTDLSMTFQFLGAFVGGIGLAVASVTLFIVIFINAIAREKYIGIMKAIGIKSKIIKASYVFQSIFYAVIGSTIGFLILWLIMVPYFKRNPIDFPFSDGILAVSAEGIIIRIIILVLSAVAAGYIPARIIVKKNTIDSLLGR
jgi:lipoprotein-releasing system permease protein